MEYHRTRALFKPFGKAFREKRQLYREPHLKTLLSSRVIDSAGQYNDRGRLRREPTNELLQLARSDILDVFGKKRTEEEGGRNGEPSHGRGSRCRKRG